MIRPVVYKWGIPCLWLLLASLLPWASQNWAEYDLFAVHADMATRGCF